MKSLPYKKYILLGALILFVISLAVPAAARPLTVDASLLNVRSGPGTNHSIITQVPTNTILTEISESGSWAHVALPDGRKGWVSTNFTSPFLPQRYAVVDTALLNVRSGPGTNHGIVTQVSRDTAVPVLQEQNTWFRVLLPQGGQAWVAGWLTNSFTGVDYVKVTASALNFRSGPGTNHQILDCLPQNEVLAVLARSNGWERVARFNGDSGWVSGTYTAPLGQSGGGQQPTPPAPTPPTANSPLRGKTIVIDPGHGGPDPGAVGITGYFEKSVNFSVAQELAPLLRDAGATVLMTRWSDWGPTLWERVNLANTNRADVFVSIHANAHPQSWVSGTETYYNPWGPHAARSRSLATNLQNQLVAALGIRDIGVKTAGFYVISNTHMPSALVELGFLSNRSDEALLRHPETHRRSAQALFRGLENYFR